MKRALLLLALLLNVGLAGAAELPQPAVSPALQACPVAADRLDLAVVQGDCCKGHKGVCGCRAGKIVCCDNSKSATCTCRADEGVDL